MRSMTGFAGGTAEASGRRWRWEIKSVNGRGLDLRFRLADNLGANEADLRAIVAKHATRGSVMIQLWEDLVRDEGAHDLIRADGPVGRKLDFLSQEFNCEVNTLCSKSGSAELTRVGLAMKVVVDQIREQAQNVE